jgi:hypothetical protein
MVVSSRLRSEVNLFETEPLHIRFFDDISSESYGHNIGIEQCFSRGGFVQENANEPIRQLSPTALTNGEKTE